MPVSKMWESIEVLIQTSLKSAQDHVGAFPAYPSGKSSDETSRKMDSGRNSSTTPFRKLISLSAEMNGMCTEASYSYTGTKGTCKDSNCTVNSVQGRATGYRGVSTGGERTLMSAVARQPVSTAIEADRSSFEP